MWKSCYLFHSVFMCFQQQRYQRQACETVWNTVWKEWNFQSPNDAHIYFAWKVNMHAKFSHFGRSLIKQWKVYYSNILKYLLLLYHFLFVKEILPKWWIFLAYFLPKSTCRIIAITKVKNLFIHCHVKCVCLCIKMWSKTS